MDGSSAGMDAASLTVEQEVIGELDLTELNEFTNDHHASRLLSAPTRPQSAAPQPATNQRSKFSKAEANEEGGLQTSQNQNSPQPEISDHSAEWLRQIAQLPAMVQKLHEGYTAAVASLAVRVNQLEAKFDKLAAGQDSRRIRRHSGRLESEAPVSQATKTAGEGGVTEHAGQRERVSGDEEFEYRTPLARQTRASLTPLPVFKFPRLSLTGDTDEQHETMSPTAESGRAGGKRKRGERGEERVMKKIRRWPLPRRRSREQESAQVL